MSDIARGRVVFMTLTHVTHLNELCCIYEVCFQHVTKKLERKEKSDSEQEGERERERARVRERGREKETEEERERERERENQCPYRSG